MFHWESPSDVVANELDCNMIESEFELQSCNYFHRQINIFGKGSYGLNSTTVV